MNPYRSKPPHPCDYHIAPSNERLSDWWYDSGVFTENDAGTLYFPRCGMCHKYVDVSGRVIGHNEMLAEMQTRSEMT